MESILEQLYNIKTDPFGEEKLKTEEERETCRQIRECTRDFIDELNQHDSSLVDQFLDLLAAQGNQKAYYSHKTFIDGFCAGVKLMAEVLTHE